MRQRWADYRVFWREFRQQYHTTGAVLPSGRALARALVHYVRDNGEAHVAEYATADSNLAVSEKLPYVLGNSDSVRDDPVEAMGLRWAMNPSLQARR